MLEEVLFVLSVAGPLLYKPLPKTPTFAFDIDIESDDIKGLLALPVTLRIDTLVYSYLQLLSGFNSGFLFISPYI